MDNKKHKRKYNNTSETNYYIIFGFLFLVVLIIIVDNMFKKTDMPSYENIPVSVPVSVPVSASVSGLEAKTDIGSHISTDNKPNISNIYFEKQDAGLSCGRQAVNNLIGRKFYDNKDTRAINQDIFTNNNNNSEPINLMTLCKYIQKEIKNEEKKKELFGCSNDENYSYHILCIALNMAKYEIPVWIDNDAKTIKKPRIRAEMGFTEKYSRENFGLDSYKNKSFLVNLDLNKNIDEKEITHWVSVRYINNEYYYMDGLKDGPIKYTRYDDLVEYLIERKFKWLYAFSPIDNVPILDNIIKEI